MKYTLIKKDLPSDFTLNDCSICPYYDDNLLRCKLDYTKNQCELTIYDTSLIGNDPCTNCENASDDCIGTCKDNDYQTLIDRECCCFNCIHYTPYSETCLYKDSICYETEMKPLSSCSKFYRRGI